jgi:hypothetical protein
MFGFGAGGGQRYDAGVARSVTSSNSASGPRGRADRLFAAWRDSVMAPDLSTLRALHGRVAGALLLAIGCCTTGFCLTDLVLYGSVAGTALGLLTKADNFRPDLISMLHTTRHMHLAAMAGDEARLSQLRLAMADIASSHGDQHLENYQSCPSGAFVPYLPSFLPLMFFASQ